MLQKILSSGACIGAVACTWLWVAAPASAAPRRPPTVTCAYDLVLSGSCEMELAALCTATEEASSLRDQDRERLVGKVVEASIKLSHGKFADAEKKLSDYEMKLNALINARKPKIRDADADTLDGALLDAQLCVAAIP